MKAMEQSWGKFLPRALVLGAIIAASVFVAIQVANAVTPGVRGGHSRSALTVAGTLTLPPRTVPHLTFTFTKPGAMPPPMPCVVQVPPPATGYIEATGAFSAEVDIESCPSLFDGADVQVMVDVHNTTADGAVLVTTPNRPINPVPYARYADHYGTPDCPVGYERSIDPSEGFPSDAGTRLCRKLLGGSGLDARYDDVVRVGDGASAFWIDRFEASVWQSRDATATSQRGVDGADYDSGSARLPLNGQYTGAPHYARSLAGVFPSRYITWFQANETCFASGKRLPHGDEWLLAARGTPDPPTPALGAGVEGRCLTNVGAVTRTGGRAPATGRIGCQSFWGVEDMIGNVTEWTSEWFAGAATLGTGDGELPNWGVDFGNDSTRNVGGVTAGFGGGATTPRRVPAAALRGGAWDSQTNAGVFAIDLGDAPSNFAVRYGFRCVIPR